MVWVKRRMKRSTERKTGGKTTKGMQVCECVDNRRTGQADDLISNEKKVQIPPERKILQPPTLKLVNFAPV